MKQTAQRRSAVMLVELIIALPLLMLVLSLLAWALVNQFNISRGVARQTDRQAVMQQILRTMRADLLAADTVDVQHFDAGQGVPDDIAALPTLPPAPSDAHRNLVAKITASQPETTVIYHLIAESPDVPRSANSTLPDLPPKYFLIRRAEHEKPTTGVWALRSLLLSIPELPRNIADKRTSVRLVFESSQHLDARAPIQRTFDTTLRTGGTP